jgi:hypothetical protein
MDKESFWGTKVLKTNYLFSFLIMFFTSVVVASESRPDLEERLIIGGPEVSSLGVRSNASVQVNVSGSNSPSTSSPFGSPTSSNPPTTRHHITGGILHTPNSLGNQFPQGQEVLIHVREGYIPTLSIEPVFDCSCVKWSIFVTVGVLFVVAVSIPLIIQN